MRLKIAALSAAAMLLAAPLEAQPEPTRPVFRPDGSVQVPGFVLPPSAFASKEAADALRARAGTAITAFPATKDIAGLRAAMEAQLAPLVGMMRQRYPARMTEDRIAGVPVRIFTPSKGAPDATRVLINLHGGAFMMCATACALLESLPIAEAGGFRVISVDYREGPEARFPAASEDVAAVYRELLKRYRPQQIGIYGCSAGGALAAQTAAWLPAHGLPQAGAIGIFGSGAVEPETGDSAYVAGHTDTAFAPPPLPGAPAAPKTPLPSYFEGADPRDPMLYPGHHMATLAKFPPTLVITGTRAPDLSPAVFTHAQLVKAGAPSELIVGEGVAHCYIYSPQLPEAQDAYRTITSFFRRHLR